MSPLPCFQIIRASRRSISIQISPKKWLIVRAPFSIPEDIIHAFVDKKSDWINKHIHQQMRQDIWSEQNLYYLGKPHRYTYDASQKEPILHTDGVFIFSQNTKCARKEWEEIKKWYGAQAKLHIRDRVHFFAKQYNFKYQNIKITSALTRWGSCSGNNNLNFPWRLLMVPTEVIDYVIVHELAHTVHKNHSPRFWWLVESIVPDWNIHRAHLKAEGYRYILHEF